MSKKTEHLKESKVFCMAPWVHTHIWPNGDVYPCCMSDTNLPITNYKTDGDLKTVWNSDGYKKLRENMLTGKESVECNRCYEQEQHGKYNLRMQLNNEFAHRYDLVENTIDDGQLDQLELLYLDIRFSNICNLMCRTCGPDLSSQWGAVVAAKYPERKQPALIRIESSSKNKEFWDDLSQYIENVERIYFAGGEPLLMQEHYNVLEYLMEHKKYNINIYYNTNFSTLNYKNTSVLDYWKDFRNIVVCASLDGSHEKGELIRKGLDWDTVIENRKRMIEECPHVRFILAPTISVFNADHVLDFYEEWVELGLVKKYDIQFNVLLFPSAYRIELLPDDIKSKIVTRIDKIIEDTYNDPEALVSGHLHHRSSAFVSEIQQFKNALLNITDESTREEHLRDFNRRVEELDHDRNESTWEIFPNLHSLKR